MGRALAVLALALIGFGGFAAHALASPSLEAGGYTATLTGGTETSPEDGAHAFGFEAGTTATCAGDASDGTLGKAGTIFTVHRVFAECQAFGFLKAPIVTTGCDYRYELGKTIVADTYGAKVELVCEAGKQIKISTSTCEVQIPAQVLSGTVEVVANTGTKPHKDISVLSALSGIRYLKTKDGFLCPLNGTGEAKDGTTSGGETIGAESGGGVDLQVTELPTPTLEAGAYPATLTGNPEGISEMGSEHVFGFEKGTTATCSGDSSDGNLSKASTSFVLHRVFSECQAFGFLEAPIVTTGCDYRYELGEKIVADTYGAKVELVCEAGKQIKIVAGTCEVQISAQALGGTVEVIDNTGAVPQDDISIVSSLKEIDYTTVKDGFLCPLNGTGERSDGTTTSLETVVAETSSRVPLAVIG